MQFTPLVFIDARHRVVNGLNQITRFIDRSGNGLDLVYNSGQYITADGIAGVCNGSQNDYRIGSVGDFNCLHDGSGCTVLHIFEGDSTSSGTDFLYLSNIGGGIGAQGRVTYPSALSDAPGFYNYLVQATSSFNAQSGANAATKATGTIYGVRFGQGAGQDIRMYEDGLMLQSYDDSGFSWSQADHNDPLRVNVGNTGKFLGFIVFPYVLSDADFDRVHGFCRQYFRLNTVAKVVEILGDSTVEGIVSSSGLSSEYTGKIERSYIYGYKNGNTALDLGFNQVELANMHVDTVWTAVGFDLPMMYRITNQTSGKWFLLKAALSGSDLYAKWNKTGFPELAAGWDEYEARFYDFVAKLRAIGFTKLDFGLVVIGLGINDSGATFRADSFATNLVNLIDDIRHLHNHSTLPVLVIDSNAEGYETPDATHTTVAYQGTVLAAQASVVASDSGAASYRALSTGSPAYSEASPLGIHLDQASLVQEGTDIANLILTDAAGNYTLAADNSDY